jgi:hypothetical protein
MVNAESMIFFFVHFAGRTTMPKITPLFDANSFFVESLLSGTHDSENYLKGLVHITWGKEAGQMNLAQTRALAIRLIEVANCAETDELLVRFLHNRVGLPLEASVAALRDLREMRKDWLPKETSS